MGSSCAASQAWRRGGVSATWWSSGPRLGATRGLTATTTWPSRSAGG